MNDLSTALIKNVNTEPLMADELKEFINKRGNCGTTIEVKLAREDFSGLTDAFRISETLVMWYDENNNKIIIQNYA